MNDIIKTVDAILKHPGHLTLALLSWSLISIAILGERIEGWPSSILSQEMVKLLFVLLAWLTAILLLTKAANWLSAPLGRSFAKTARILGRRNELAKLSDDARAALKAVSETGFSWFHGEPNESYVSDLRANGFVRVDVAGDGWGHYYLTSKALSIVNSDFQYYHSMLNVPNEVSTRVCASMAYAERVAKSLAKPRRPTARS